LVCGGLVLGIGLGRGEKVGVVTVGRLVGAIVGGLVLLGFFVLGLVVGFFFLVGFFVLAWHVFLVQSNFLQQSLVVLHLLPSAAHVGLLFVGLCVVAVDGFGVAVDGFGVAVEGFGVFTDGFAVVVVGCVVPVGTLVGEDVTAAGVTGAEVGDDVTGALVGESVNGASVGLDDGTGVGLGGLGFLVGDDVEAVTGEEVEEEGRAVDGAGVVV